MRRVLHAFTLAAAVIFVSAVAAHAADWCFDSGGVTLVAQNFAKPAKGSCKVLFGHMLSGDPISGTACLNSGGDTLRVGYTIHRTGFAEIGRLTIPYPALTGGSANFINVYDAFNETGSGGASAAVCNPQPVP
jgi:hypothetical protein